MPTVTPDARIMSAVALTVAVAVVPGRFEGVLEVAVICATPGATPVTGTFTLVAFVENVTVGATVAEAVLSDARAMVSPDGAGLDRFSVRFCVDVPVIVKLRGVKFIVPLT